MAGQVADDDKTTLAPLLPCAGGKACGVKLKTERKFMKTAQIPVAHDQYIARQVVLHGVRVASAEETLAANRPLPLNASLRIQAAEYWLILGEADQALKELEKLPSRSWKYGWAVKTRIAAMGVLSDRAEATLQE